MVICDLERLRIIDILPDHEAATVEVWLDHHRFDVFALLVYGPVTTLRYVPCSLLRTTVTNARRRGAFHCGAKIANVKANLDHVPSKSLLSKVLRQRGTKYDQGRGEPDSYLPQVVICERCNSGFSRDETYLLCVLHAVLAGSLYPDPKTHPDAANVCGAIATSFGP